MNTPLQLLEQDLVPSLPIHHITTCSSMLVLDMMQPILPHLPRGGMYIQLLEPKISMLLKNPTKHTSIMTLTHHQMTSIRYTKPNKASHHLHPYLGFREITPESQPLYKQKTFKNLMALYMSLQTFISSSAQRLLLPSRNTILRPPTKLLTKGAFMSLTLLTMNQPHLRIPHLRSNLIPIHLMIHPQMSLTQSWTISIANITKQKT